MKRNILILLTLWIFTSTSCLYKNSIAYPGINIYKTNADYFNNVSVYMSDGEITGRPSVRMPILSGTDTMFFHRYKLNNNYIATQQAWFEREVFLDLTYTGYIELQNQMGGYIPEDTIYKHILDKNPFIVFYSETTPSEYFMFQNNDGLQILDTTALNTLIKDGDLEKYFTRYK